MSLRASFDTILAAPRPLELLDDWVWDGLVAGSLSIRHAWSTAAFSTVERRDSGVYAPRSRTVVSRRVNRDMRTLEFFTDVRSAKIHQLQSEHGVAEVCWLFYRPSTLIQLRVEGRAELLTGEAEEAAWWTTPLRSREVYSSIEPPGLVRSSFQPPETTDRELTESELKRGRENFRVVRTTVATADVLYLKREGHVRARIVYRDGETPATHWVVP